jgi:hypothetical protein
MCFSIAIASGLFQSKPSGNSPRNLLKRHGASPDSPSSTFTSVLTSFFTSAVVPVELEAELELAAAELEAELELAGAAVGLRGGGGGGIGGGGEQKSLLSPDNAAEVALEAASGLAARLWANGATAV